MQSRLLFLSVHSAGPRVEDLAVGLGGGSRDDNAGRREVVVVHVVAGRARAVDEGACRFVVKLLQSETFPESDRLALQSNSFRPYLALHHGDQRQALV